MTRVLLTRPEPGASATARRLGELGFRPVVLPLTETQPVDVAMPPDAHRFDAVVATSGAALRHASKVLLNPLLPLPLFAVGDRTAEIARQAGFERTESAQGDVHALAAYVAGALNRGARIAYLCGRVRTGVLEESLREAGYDVTMIETYDTLPIRRPADEIASALGGESIDAALLYSPNAARLFTAELLGGNSGALFRTARLLCISQNAAQALPCSAQDRVEIAAAPDEGALLQLLGAAD